MTAEIVSVGTELLLGQILDTHASTMSRILAECGIACRRRTTVGDNWERLLEAFREALGRADLVVAIGGLGPTGDDLTRDAIAAALELPLERSPEMEERLRGYFADRGAPWTESIGRQADRPAGAEFVENPNGTAPGLFCRKGDKFVVALPGPKGEFEPMAQGPVRDRLARLGGEGVIHSKVLRVVGLGESAIEAALGEIVSGADPTVAPYAKTGEVHLRLTTHAESAAKAQAKIEPVERAIRTKLGDAVYGVDDEPLEAAVLRLMAEREESVAVAESMTGGELSARLSSVPGASRSFRGGVVAYTAEAKRLLLGIDPGVLDRAGPVSAEVTDEMAARIRERLGATYGVAITGNAGPTADAGGKPVGLVYVAVAGPQGGRSGEHRFRGLRADVRRRATQVALAELRRALLAADRPKLGA